MASKKTTDTGTDLEAVPEEDGTDELLEVLDGEIDGDYVEIEDPDLPSTGPDDLDWAEIERDMDAPVPPETWSNPVALTVEDPDALTFGQWAAMVGQAHRMERGHQWWAIDLVALGTGKWDEQVWQVLDTISAKTWTNWGYVRDAFPNPEDRRPDLTFTHHKVAADLRTKPMRKKALKLAAEGAVFEGVRDVSDGSPWTTRELTTYVQIISGTAAKKKAAAEAGPVTSISWDFGFRLAPTDEKWGKEIGEQMREHLEKLLGEFDVEPLAISGPDMTLNRGKAGEGEDSAAA